MVQLQSDHYLRSISKCLFLPLFFLSIILTQPIQAQQVNIDQTEDNLKNLYGLKRLKALNELTRHYQQEEDRKAIRYGRQAVRLGERIFIEGNLNLPEQEKIHLLRAYFQLGEVLYQRENYFEAMKYLESSQLLSQELGQDRYVDRTADYLAGIQERIESGEIKENFFNKAFNDIKIGEVIGSATNDLTIKSQINLGEADEKKGDYQAAMKHYQKAINLLKNKGDAEMINELNLRVAFILDSLEQHLAAQEFLNVIITDMESEQAKASVKVFENQIEITPVPEMKAPSTPEPPQSPRTRPKNLKELSDRFAKEKDFEKSLAYYKMYNELTQKMVEDSLLADAENKQREREIVMLRQQKEIADLNVKTLQQEREKQIRLRNTYLIISLLILISAFIALFFYLTKRRQHKRLEIAYRDLDKTKNKLAGAEQKIVKLLSQHVSGDVARQLLMNNTDKPGERCFVCIMFLDIRDFTPMAEKLSPEEIIEYQNNVFGFMIDIVQQHNGTINQLLGDGFMATFGAPVSKGNDCQNAFEASQVILSELKDRSQAGLIPKTRVGIGLHAGHVVTGNVGNEQRKQYSVTGNPVIIASRVEQLNKTYKSQMIITEEVFHKLDQPVNLKQPFLEVEVKGRSNPVKILKIA
jgi:class 3 adenylate cyclase